MDSIRLDNYGLHHSALLGDDEGVLHALQAGADVNLLDEAGRTVIMCVVAGENWRDIDASDAVFMNRNRLNALRILLTRAETSLLTLNAPHATMNGVVPLGIAAWLNQPLAVCSLLDDSVQSVAVDGMDSHGATALMYAARDGNLDVAKILLSHGARPDFRDYNHRTSIQFALPHPSVLWLCESFLRRHRWRESKTVDRTRLTRDSEDLVQLAQSCLRAGVHLEPPPFSAFTKETTSRLSDTLISSVCSGDLSAIHSLLFSSSVSMLSSLSPSSISGPILVNIPDNKGWSPIHHCVAAHNPSTQILDALYCAGADVSLFTTLEQQTPLHILSRSFQFAELSHSLATFILHLIQDLRAPLSARDKDDETCVHIAAEHGKCLGLLTLLLECDVSGTVRKMKNSRGLTPEDVCRREFLSAFHPRTVSSNSILPDYIHSTDSLISPSEYTLLESPIHDDASSIRSTSHFDVDTAVEGLLSDLSVTSPSINHARTPVHIQKLEDSLYNADDQCSAIAVHFRARIEEATQVLQELESKVERIDSLRNIVCLASRGKILARELSPLRPRRRQRDSKDSLATLSSSEQEVFIHVPVLPSDSCLSPSVCVGTQTGLLDFVTTISMTKTSDVWIDGLCGPSESIACKTYLKDLWNIEHELTILKNLSLTNGDAPSSLKLATKIQNALKKKGKLEAKLVAFSAGRDKTSKQRMLSGPSRVKAWLKRIVTQDHQPPPRKLEIVLDVDEDQCSVGREVKMLRSLSMKKVYDDPLDATIDAALRTSQVVLDNARHDLESIHNHLTAAQSFINSANHSISRTQRVFKRAVKKREDLIADLRAKSSGSDLLFPNDIAIAARTSVSSISTIYSASSDTATVTGHTDEDLRHIRRLLLRKIEAQISGAWDEVDKITVWLQIIKEAVRGVKRRAYL